MIISPKRSIENLQQMALYRFNEYFVKIWETAKKICEIHPEYNDSFVMVGNGGKRQEVQQVHFHMFTNHEIVNEYSAQEYTENVFYCDKEICVLEHPNPNWEIHFVVRPTASSPMSGNDEYNYFCNVLHSIDLLHSEFNIVQSGYSFVYQHNKQKNDKKCPVFHIVSGKKIQ